MYKLYILAIHTIFFHAYYTTYHYTFFLRGSTVFMYTGSKSRKTG